MSLGLIVLEVISFILCIGAFAPLTKSEYWLLRGQDYFKQFYLLLAIIFLALFFYFSYWNVISLSLVFALFGVVLYCAMAIFPFTFLGQKTIKKVTDLDPERQIKLLIFNVYQYNESYQKAIETIKEENPDVVFLLETCSKWENELKELDEKYPYCVKAIQEDTYGLILWSKIAFNTQEIKYIVKNNVPSAEVQIEIAGKPIRIYGLHPKPPVPGEEEYATNKDKEIIRTAKDIVRNKHEEASLLIGDLNDVAWSKSNVIFKKLTGMKDLRQGRGFLGTFPTYLPFKIPLDHVFCSEEFELVEFKILDDIGSDHFPVSVTLQF